jgi:hypothetical protein
MTLHERTNLRILAERLGVSKKRLELLSKIEPYSDSALHFGTRLTVDSALYSGTEEVIDSIRHTSHVERANQ